MSRGLEHGEHLVEQAELGEAAATSRPAQDARHLRREAGAGDERGERVGQAQLVVRDQFVRPHMGAPSGRSVRRQQHRIGERQHALE